MERLTYDFAANGQHCWQVKGADNALCKEVCRDQGDSGCKDCPIAKAFDRLAAYEDTGLEPEICAEYKKFEDEAVSKNVPFSRIVELMEAEAEGRLLVLPCKVGDTVYWIKGKAILEVYIQWFETNAYGWCACGTYPPMAIPTFRFADFGKTVFLTRAAAEAALAKERDADG